MKKIVFVAGDISGDFYAGILSKKLKELYGDKIVIYSFGGMMLQKNSCQKINLTEQAVSGIFEAIVNLKKIAATFGNVYKEITHINPDLIILVDFPDFNLRLAKTLKKFFKILYYISPQVWAWRRKRIELIKKYTDGIIVIFEFEEEIYKEKGVSVKYFGHPLLDIVNKGNIPQEELILFLPGSP